MYLKIAKMKIHVMSLIQLILLTTIYVIVVSVVTGILITTGFDFPEMNVARSVSFMQLIFAGLISSFLVVYIVCRYKQLKKLNFFLIVFFILFLSNFSVTVEGNIFTPDLITNSVLFSLFIQQILIGLIFSSVATIMNRKRLTGTSEPFLSSKLFGSAFTLKLAAGSLTYMLMYYVWGRINYSLFTKPFYDMGISGLDVPSSFTLIKYIFVRGILITLSIVPFLKFAQPDNARKIYETGIILFLFGGVIPLSLTLGIFPLDFALYSLAEIFLQNFLAGIIIYLIFSTKILSK